MKQVALMLVLSVVILSYANESQATSMIEQTYTIYGKTSGEPSMVLWDVALSGANEHRYIYALFMLPDCHYLLLPYRGYDLRKPAWGHDFMDNLPTEPSIQLTDSMGCFYINDSVFIRPPDVDSTFDARAAMLKYGVGSAAEWRDNCSRNCIDYPQFYGVQEGLVYMDDRGLYKNYEFKDVIYFPESGYVALITNQPRKGHGLDTMHGLLIYKLTFPAETEKRR